MLTIATATRIESTSKGLVYFHRCKSCTNEIGPNRPTALRQRTGYCNRCFKQQANLPEKRLLTVVRTQAARRKIGMSLTQEDTAFLLQIKACYYCGEPVSPKRSASNLDRRDPTLGYDFDNVVVCCFKCNRVKNNVLSCGEMRLAMLAVRAYRRLDRDGRQHLEYAISSEGYK